MKKLLMALTMAILVLSLMFSITAADDNSGGSVPETQVEEAQKSDAKAPATADVMLILTAVSVVGGAVFVAAKRR